MAFLAQVTYTGNGSTTQYSIPFEFIDSTHVKAFIDGTETSAFTISSSTLTFTTAPANASVVRIERQTPTDARLIDFTDGSVLTESDLDRSADQNFYIAQEITDDSASKLGLDTDDKYDANNKVIKNLANPVNNNDAVNKTYLENTWLSPANKTALTTVNANIANINAVNANETNINSVNSNEANINTVATNISSVNTVATDIAKVITVANDLAEAVSEVETVADDLNEATSEIDTVSNNIANVNTVGTNIANVNTVAGISSDVTTVAGISSDVQAVENISGNVTTVAGISSDVTSVANDATDIGTVATDIANVNTVAGISGNVSTVAGISSNVTSVANNSANINSVAGNSTNINTVAGNNSNVTTVAGISSNVTTVAGISSDVSAVAGDATDIGTVATNLTGTNTIGTVAGSIANVNNVGGSIANVNTVATNIASVNNFGEVYRISATAPTTSLDAGDLYFDTATDTLKVYGSSGWQNAGSSVNGTSQRYNYTATSGQTTFTGADNNGNTLTYDAGYIDVYLNGVKLLNGTDVTVTSGSSVVLASGATTGDVVDIVAYGTFSVASLNADNLDSGTVPDARLSGSYTNLTGLTVDGDITFKKDDGTTLILENSTTGSYVGDGTELQGAIHFKNRDASGDDDHIGAKIESYVADNVGRGNLEFYTGRSATGSDIYKRIEIAQDGNISFYETSGTTAKFKWDAFTERLGVGTSSPESTLHVVGTSDLQSPIKVKGATLNGNTLISDRYLENESLMNIGIAHSGGALVLGSLVKPSESSESDATGYLSSQDTFSSKRSAIKIDGDDGTIKFLNTNTSATVAVDTAVAMTERVRIHSNGVTAFNDGIALGVGVNNTSSNVLDDYEEGTWNPSENNGVTLTDNETPRYTKIGDTVHVWFDVTVASNSNGNAFDLSGVPFSARDIGSAGGVVYFCDMNNSISDAGLSFTYHATALRVQLRSGYDATVSLSNMSGHRISGCLIYKTTD